MAVQFGVVSADSSTYGIIQNVEQTSKGEVKTYPNAAGDTAGYQMFDETLEISFDFVYDGTMTPPVEGDTFTKTVMGTSVKLLVVEVGQTETVDDFRKVKLTCKRWKPVGIPA